MLATNNCINNENILSTVNILPHSCYKDLGKYVI